MPAVLVSPGPFPPDIYEPNDTFAAATNLGFLGNISKYRVDDRPAGNDDYYHFTAASTGQATIITSFTNSSGDLDLQVFNASQTVLGSSASTSNSESVTISVTKDSLTLFAYMDSTEPAKPELQSDNHRARDPARFFRAKRHVCNREEPWHRRQLLRAELSIHAANNDDYYKDYGRQHRPGDDRVRRSSMRVATSIWPSTTPVEPDRHFSWHNQRRERHRIARWGRRLYFVRVYGFNGATNGDYSLSISGPAIPPDSYEPNDSFATATNLGAMGSITRGGLSIHAANNDDYFRVTAAGNGIATISTSFSNARG